jgi:rod shape determining protein RodA
MLRGLSWRHFDFWLLGAIILAIAFGVAMIRSAIAGNEEIAASVSRQIYFGIAGLVVIFLVASIDYRYWLALYRPMYLVMMALLVMIFLGAQTRFGSARWFQIGQLLIQPTELAKIIIIIILARYFEKNQDSPRNLRWAIFSFLWMIGLAIWILLQPNLSNVIVLAVIWFFMLWMSGVPIRYLLAFGLLGIVLAVLAFPFLQPYQQQRVITFILPNPNASYGATYNVQQALIAIGSGGLLGKGYGHGTQTQLRFLKVRHTDFIFSAIAEEFGMVGALIVIAVLIFIIIRCLRAARMARDLSGSLIAYGVAVLIFFQTAVNIGVNMNLIPVSGLPLPFISYGGSGLLSMMLGIGLVESVVLRHRQLEF